MNIPAGFSPLLGNRLGLTAYATLNGRFVDRLDVSAPCPAPRPNHPDRARRLEEFMMAPERVKPETLPPAGGLVARVRGKKIIEDNTNYLSNVDTLIFGRDVDGSMGARCMAKTVTYAGRAGLDPKIERDPAWGQVPPVCKRTFGEDPYQQEWDAGTDYARHDPRAEDEQCQRS